MRLFLALETPEALAADLLATLPAVSAIPAHGGLRPVPAAQCHLTLRFLGECDADSAARIVTAMATLAPREIVLTVQGTGRFRPRQGAVLWAGLAPNAALDALRQDVDVALAMAGVAADTRPFKPHLTLARCGPAVPEAVQRQWLSRTAALAAPAWQAQRVVLFESQLHATGAVHRIHATSALHNG